VASLFIFIKHVAMVRFYRRERMKASLRRTSDSIKVWEYLSSESIGKGEIL